MERLLYQPKWKLLDEKSRLAKKLIKCRKLPFKRTIKSIVLVPLSPLQIYKVHIIPNLFTFGNVSTSKYKYIR